MASTDAPLRGEIWLASLGASRPGEPGKTRPTLIVTPEALAVGTPTDLVTVVPISSSGVPSPLAPELNSGNGLDANSVAVVRAVRSVARKRLIKRVGKASRQEQFEVDQALLLALGLVRAG